MEQEWNQDIPSVDNNPPQDQPPADPIPQARPEDSGFYRNVGTGRKESPFADSPYEMNFIPQDAPDSDLPPVSAPKQQATSGRGTGKKIAAAVAALAVVAGSCGITAWAVNRRWERETTLMYQDFHQELEELRTQVASQSSSGSSIVVSSGGDVSAPALVYAQNVNSVASVSNYATVSLGWGNQASQQLVGTGSGFLISADGYIITNYHVVEGAERLSITTHMGQEYEASLVGSDQVNDVALLKVEATGLDPVEIGSSDDLAVGDMVIAIGNPLGELTATATVGYVSGKDRSVSTDGTIINMLQTDAAINSGNSGGPLFNAQGQVIGITTAKYSGSSSSGASIEGIGFAIPIDDVISMIDDFKNYGYLRNQAYLGVTVINMDSSTAQMYSLPTGSYVQSVVEGSCAEKAGIKPQDIIINLGGYDVDSNSTLTSVLRRFSAGDTVRITVFRSGAEVELSITFDERPQDVSLESTDPTIPGEMPDTGSYDEWYDYFSRYFGSNGNG